MKHPNKIADQHEQETFAPLESQETDPSGLNPHAPGAKLDAGKPMVDDILAGFPRALMGVVEVGTFGAKKYSLNGYKEVENAVRRYRNAAGRHRLAIQRGETHDPESKLLHRFHEAWNVLASLELELMEQDNGL